MIATAELRQMHNQLKFTTFNPTTDFSQLNNYFEAQPLDHLLSWSLATFGDKVAQVTSFGPTGMVILDCLAKLSPGIRIITVDTDFLFEETYKLIEEVWQRYPINLEIRRPVLSPEEQAQQYGPQLWATNPNLCCHLRKVIPTQQVLQELEAWLTGLRRDQASTRADLPLITWDTKYNLVKINPLAGWTRSQVWAYIVDNNVPYNALHDRGYASIGCTHCTLPTDNEDDERSGRWRGHQKIECGIHVP
jgi:phosphoadenosine phosphosulfate reductase